MARHLATLLLLLGILLRFCAAGEQDQKPAPAPPPAKTECAWARSDGVEMIQDGKLVHTLKLADVVKVVEKRKGKWRVEDYTGSPYPRTGWVRSRDLLRTKPAADLWNELIEKDPKNARAYYGLATVGKYGTNVRPFDHVFGAWIVADLDTAIRLAPDFASAYFERGDCHYMLLSYERAVTDLTTAIRLNPRYVGAYGLRAECWKRLGEYRKALADYSELIRLERRQGGRYLARAEVRVALAQYDEALADLKQAQRLGAPRHKELEVEVWMGKHEYDKVIELTTDILRELDAPDEYDDYLYFNLARARAGKGDYRQAAKDFDKAYGWARKYLEFKDQGPTIAWFFATCPDEQVRDGAKALRIAIAACCAVGTNADPEVFDVIGYFNYRGAQSDLYWMELIRPGWKDWRCLDVLAAACAEVGRFDDAVRVQTKALKIAPEKERAPLRARLELYKARKPYHAKPVAEASRRTKE